MVHSSCYCREDVADFSFAETPMLHSSRQHLPVVTQVHNQVHSLLILVHTGQTGNVAVSLNSAQGLHFLNNMKVNETLSPNGDHAKELGN